MAQPGRPSRVVAATGLALSVLGPLALTAILSLAGGPKLRDYAFLFVGLVAILGVTYGLWPALIAAAASFLLVDYFFVPPYYTFTIGSEQDVVNLLVLLGAAGFVGGLGSLRRRAQLRAALLAAELRATNLELERLNREQAEAAQVALRLAVTEEQVKVLEESDRARREFLANVSHDLRTPITTILTESSLPADETDARERARAAFDLIAGEARRLNAIVADMLDMARIEGNALDLQLEPVDLGEAIGAALERMRRTSPGRAVSVEAGDRPVFVLADWGRLGQVLDNLLGNADRAAPPGSAVEVRIQRDAADNLVEVRVSDRGPGIPPELGDRVFERFVRGEASGGTGLGLSIVRGVVEAHGGRVWLEPVGVGATVAFSLPLADLADDADGGAPEPQPRG